MKKAQITAIELSLFFLLFTSSLIFFTTRAYEGNVVDYKFTVDSALDSIYYSENFREQIMDESLTTSALLENWTNLSTFLNASFTNYEFIVANEDDSNVKRIFECDVQYDKYYSERVVYIENNNEVDFRKIRLGVCF